MLARTTRPDSVPAFSVGGAAVLPLAAGEDTGGRYEAFVLEVAPGGRSPLHTLSADKVFHAMTGTMVVTLDGVEHAITGSATAHVPAGSPHCYENRSGSPARLLVITSGTGQLAFLAGMAELAADGPPTAEALAAHTAAHGVRLLAGAGRPA